MTTRLFRLTRKVPWVRTTSWLPLTPRSASRTAEGA
jgi:hypothetical protein